MLYQNRPSIDIVTKKVVAEGAVLKMKTGEETWFSYDYNNEYYANFKAQINADEAQLEDADGNLMTAEDAKAFVATLP